MAKAYENKWERRDAERFKAKHGMRVTGRNVARVINNAQAKRAAKYDK